MGGCGRAGDPVRDSGDAVNHIQRENLRLFLEWQEKYRRCYVEFDAWPLGMRLLFDRFFAAERAKAREWLTTKRARQRTRTQDSVRGIWTAKRSLERRKS